MLASRCNVVKANARQCARPVATPRPQRSIAVLATANKQQHVAKASVPKEPSTLQIAASAAAAALLLLNAGPVFAEGLGDKPPSLNALTGGGNAPLKELSPTNLDLQLKKADRVVKDQTTDVKEAAKGLKQGVVDQAKQVKDQASPSKAPGAAGQAAESAGEGLKSNLTELKNKVGL